jgi:VanZ family protein
MIIEILKTIIVCGLYFSFLLTLLMAFMLFGNFFRKNDYDGLYTQISIFSIVICLIVINLLMIAYEGQDYLMVSLSLALFIYFFTFVVFQKCYRLFQSEKYLLSYSWIVSLFITALLFALSGDAAGSKNTLPLVNWVLTLLPLKITIDPALINYYMRKSWHIFIYCVLYVVWFKTILLNKNGSRLKAAVFALGFCLLVASIDEWHQSLFPSRMGQIQDVVLDLSAAVLMALVTLTYGSLLKAHISRKPCSSKARLS